MIFITSTSQMGQLKKKQLELEFPRNVSYLLIEWETLVHLFNSCTAGEYSPEYPIKPTWPAAATTMFALYQNI